MTDFWNFKDFLAVAGFYWPWLLASGLFGLVLGFASCADDGEIPPQFRSTHDIEW